MGNAQGLDCGLIPEKGIHEFFTIKDLKVFHLLAYAYVFDGDLELVGYAYHDAALSGAVKFGQSKRIHFSSRCKLFGLL